MNNSRIHAKVTSKGRGVYEVAYSPVVRGRHTLIVKVNGTQIAGSPFQVFTKIHPTQLGKPVRVIEGVCHPWGIAIDSKQQLVVAEWDGKKVTVFDKDGKMVQTITSGRYSSGVVVDKDDNIYVSYSHGSGPSLTKFSKDGGEQCTLSGNFSWPTNIKVINDKLYVCDRDNSRFQVLNTKLEYINSFGCCGVGNGQFHQPKDIAQDRAGNLYVTDSGNNRVQVFDCNGQFLSTFSTKGTSSKRLVDPRGICVSWDQFIYVCERDNKCVSVFKTSGEFVTSFGQFSFPAGIVIDDDGFVYVSNYERAGKVYIL